MTSGGIALPGGGNANDTWTSLSATQRTILEVAARAVNLDADYVFLPMFNRAPSLVALARRGITEHATPRLLTARGVALLRWRVSPAGDAWVTAWTEQHQ
jgi:hypothetical protein